MPSRSLNDLDSRFRPLVNQFIAQCEAANVPLTITYTLRTQTEQDAAVVAHRSEVTHSMHEAHPPEGKALAIDVCPTVLIQEPNYAPASPLWWQIGEIGKALGMRWGGQWSRPEPPPVGHVPAYLFDPGHFEYVL